MDIRTCVNNNFSLNLIKRIHSEDCVFEELRLLEAEGVIDLHVCSIQKYNILDTSFEENRLYDLFLKNQIIDRSEVSPGDLALFIDNKCGQIKILEDKIQCVKLLKPNVYETKLKNGLRISSEDVLNTLQKRHKIHRYNVQNILDYTHKCTNKPRLNSSDLISSMAFGDFMSRISTGLSELGFNRVVSPECNPTTWAFDKMQCDEFHPVRNETDTFYIESKQECLRPHLTGSVFYAFNRLGIKEGRYYEIGRVFRNEREDKTHLMQFFQLEISVFEDNLSLKEAFGVLHEITKICGLSEPLSLSPTYYPYTCPSAEVNILRDNTLLEIAGGGMFRKCVLDTIPTLSCNSGLGIGVGLERLFLLANPDLLIKDIRQIHKKKAYA